MDGSWRRLIDTRKLIRVPDLLGGNFEKKVKVKFQSEGEEIITGTYSRCMSVVLLRNLRLLDDDVAIMQYCRLSRATGHFLEHQAWILKIAYSLKLGINEASEHPRDISIHSFQDHTCHRIPHSHCMFHFRHSYDLFKFKYQDSKC